MDLPASVTASLCREPFNYTPDFFLPFCLQADASDMGIGTVLSYELEGVDHPVEPEDHAQGTEIQHG